MYLEEQSSLTHILKECIADMKEDFLNTLAVSEKVTEEKAKLHLWEQLPAELMKVFTPLL